MSDEYIYNFCDNHKDDIRCKCLNPDASIIRIGEDTRLPYYCWYEPCKRSDALIVQSLKKNISRCNVSDCRVSLGNIRIKDGYLDVKNACGTNYIIRNDVMDIRYLNQNIEQPIINPVWIPISLIVLSCILFVIR
ncbi:hypothetical protein [Swinepox virus]|uniref:Uncharacterized protein n=1 Tax=Swinepox virus TaxID=10276 RepID=A0A881SY49_SWPV|nr:hypothetical protein [Swinepox virus]